MSSSTENITMAILLTMYFFTYLVFKYKYGLPGNTLTEYSVAKYLNTV